MSFECWWYQCKQCSHRQKELLKAVDWDAAPFCSWDGVDINKRTEGTMTCSKCGSHGHFDKLGRHFVLAEGEVPDGYLDHGDGTVTDTKNGLIVLKNVNCFGKISWQDALLAANELCSGSHDLTDGSQPGDWRLPTLEELPFLNDWNDTDFFLYVQYHSDYWSSTPSTKNTQNAWMIYLEEGIQYHTDF
ncbi:MAG: DUF1566 domain-containing protein [Magnetococcus sp. YQC-5]